MMAKPAFERWAITKGILDVLLTLPKNKTWKARAYGLTAGPLQWMRLNGYIKLISRDRTVGDTWIVTDMFEDWRENRCQK